jgi:hypothetical protein
MSRISVPAVESATGATAEVYAEVRKAADSAPNLFVALGALSVFGAFDFGENCFIYTASATTIEVPVL